MKSIVDSCSRSRYVSSFSSLPAKLGETYYLAGLFSRPYSAGVRLFLTRQSNWVKRTIRQFGLYRPNSAYQANWVKHTLLAGLFSRPYSAGVRLFLTRQPNWAKRTIQQFGLYRPFPACQPNWAKHAIRQFGLYRPFSAYQANWVKHTLLYGLFSRPYSAGIRLFLTRQPNWAKHTIRQFDLYRPNSAYQANWVKHSPRSPISLAFHRRYHLGQYNRQEHQSAAKHLRCGHGLAQDDPARHRGNHRF